MSSIVNWHDCNFELPEFDGYYLVRVVGFHTYTHVAWFDTNIGIFLLKPNEQYAPNDLDTIVFWAYMP